MEKGLVHIYHGDGKGKTTCGMGLCVRAAGAGMNVLVFQFLKRNNSSELNVLKNISNIDVLEGTDVVKFVFAMNDQEKEDMKLFYQYAWKEIIAMVNTNKYDLLFLDEVLHAVNANMIEEEQLLNFLKNKPKHLEVVMTGYYPSEKIKDAADYISFIQKEKHPFDRGIGERIGIEK